MNRSESSEPLEAMLGSRAEEGNHHLQRRSSPPDSASGSPSSLRSSIKVSRSRSDLISVWKQHGYSFTGSHCDAWLRRVPQVVRGRPIWSDRDLSAAFEEVAARLLSRPDNECWHVSGLLWAAAKVSFPGLPAIKARAEQRLLRDGSMMEPIDVCLTLWSYSQKNTGRPSPGVLTQLVEAMRLRGSEFEPMGIATSMWSLAKLGQAEHFKAAEESLRGAIVRHAEAGALEPQNVSNILYSYGSMGVRPERAVLQALLTSVQALAARGDFDGQAIANSLWALAKLGLAAEFRIVEATLRPKLTRAVPAQSLKPQEISNVLWSFGALRLRPERAVLRALLDVVGQRSKEFNQNDTAFLLGALARLGFVAEFIEVERSLRPALLHDGTSNLLPHAVSNVLQAFGEMQVEPDPELLAALSSAALAHINEFRPQDTAQCLLAYAELGLAPEPQVLIGLMQALVGSMPLCSHRHAANCAWALSIISRCVAPFLSGAGALAPSPFLQITTDALSHRLSDIPPSAFSDEELSQLFQAFLLLRTVPGCQLRLPHALVSRAEQAWRQQVDQNCRTSELQLDVARNLQAMGIEPELKACTDDGLFRVQLALRDARFALEVCGPFRFSTNTRRVSGPTLARRLLLEERGWAVVVVPFFVWDVLRADQDKKSYLAMLLTGACSSLTSGNNSPPSPGTPGPIGQAAAPRLDLAAGPVSIPSSTQSQLGHSSSLNGLSLTHSPTLSSSLGGPHSVHGPHDVRPSASASLVLIEPLESSQQSFFNGLGHGRVSSQNSRDSQSADEFLLADLGGLSLDQSAYASGPLNQVQSFGGLPLTSPLVGYLFG